MFITSWNTSSRILFDSRTPSSVGKIDPYDYPKLFSLANAFTVLGLAVGPVMMGVLHDLYDYGWAYGVAVAVSACALLLLFFAGARPVRSGMSESE